ncbi:hypothetical protein J4402_04325 [Candidatus Pacearchaeota archaeon]|nr:hypothetical protein [Candidatus Pacearchaeota archaeon]
MTEEFINTAFIAGIIAFYSFFVLAVYIYTSFAFMSIAKKARHKNPWMVWVPFIGKPLVTSQIAKMNPWPILLLILPAIALAALPFSILFSVILFIVAIPFVITFAVFYIIWQWKTFEAVGHPGWFVLFIFINLVYLVFLGIVAWSDRDVTGTKKRKR